LRANFTAALRKAGLLQADRLSKLSFGFETAKKFYELCSDHVDRLDLVEGPCNGEGDALARIPRFALQPHLDDQFRPGHELPDRLTNPLRVTPAGRARRRRVGDVD